MRKKLSLKNNKGMKETKIQSVQRDLVRRVLQRVKEYEVIWVNFVVLNEDFDEVGCQKKLK